MAVKLEEALKKQLSAVVEIAPNPDVPMVKEAVANGFYRRQSLLNVQSSLLRYFPNLAEFPRKLTITGVYNPEVFQTLLERVSEQGYYDMIKRAVWNDDLSIIDPTARDASFKKPLKGELKPPKPEGISAQALPAIEQTTAKKKATDEGQRQTSRRKEPENQETRASEKNTETSPAQTPPPQQPATPQPATQKPRLNALPERTVGKPVFQRQKISAATRKIPSRITGLNRPNPLPKIHIPYIARNAALNTASATKILGKKGLTRGALGLGGLLSGGTRTISNIIAGNNLRGGDGGGGGGGTFNTSSPRRTGNGRSIFNLKGAPNGSFGNFSIKASKKWLLLLLLLLIAILIMFGYFNSPGEKEVAIKPCASGTVNLQKEVTGLTKENNYYVTTSDKPINYVLTLSSKGGCGKDFVIEDTIGENGDLDPLSITEGGKVEGKKITWRFPSLNGTKKLSYSVVPNKSDVWVVNQATMKYSGSGSSQTAGGSCPTLQQIDENRKKGKYCSYFTPNIDIFNTSISQQKIDAFVEKYAPQYSGSKDQFKANTDLIIKKSQQVGLNPAILLGYWKAESGFGNSFGCDPTGPALPLEQELNCALGLKIDGSQPGENEDKGSLGPRCALSRSADSYACKYIQSIRAGHPEVYGTIPISMPITKFDDLYDVHGSISPNLKDNTDDAHTNCNGYNNTLQIAMELVDCTITASSSLSIGASATCPIPDGKISCGSYEGVPGKVNACHCTPDYAKANPALCGGLIVDGNLKRTAKSIDIMPAGRNGQPGDHAFLPGISGKNLKWKFKGLVTDKNGYGYLRLFQSESTPEGVWSLYMVHVDPSTPALDENTTYSSGDYVADIGPGQDHVHINIGLNIANFGGNDFNDPGWKFPDKDLGICVSN